MKHIKTITVFIILFLLVAITAVTGAQTTMNIQRAVFPSLNFKFEYDADSMLVLRDNTGRISVQIREDNVLAEQIGYAPLIQISHESSTGFANVLNNLLATRMYTLIDDSERDSVIGDVPAKVYEARNIQGAVHRIWLVGTGDGILVFDLSPVAGNPDLENAIAVAEMFADVVIGSVDFDPEELHDDFNRRCVPDSEFVSDVTIPDGTQVSSALSIIKTWSIKNDGTCIWNADYTFEMLWHSEAWNTGRWENLTPIVPYAEPGDTVEISLRMLAIPENSATLPIRVQAQYQLHTHEGSAFGTRPYADILITE